VLLAPDLGARLVPRRPGPPRPAAPWAGAGSDHPGVAIEFLAYLQVYDTLLQADLVEHLPPW